MTANQKYLIAGIVVVIGGVIIYSINNKVSGKSILSPLIPETKEHADIQYEINWIAQWDGNEPRKNDWANENTDSIWVQSLRVQSNLQHPPGSITLNQWKDLVLAQAKLYGGAGKWKNSSLTINDFDWTKVMITFDGKNPLYPNMAKARIATLSNLSAGDTFTHSIAKWFLKIF